MIRRSPRSLNHRKTLPRNETTVQLRETLETDGRLIQSKAIITITRPRKIRCCTVNWKVLKRSPRFTSGVNLLITFSMMTSERFIANSSSRRHKNRAVEPSATKGISFTFMTVVSDGGMAEAATGRTMIYSTAAGNGTHEKVACGRAKRTA